MTDTNLAEGESADGPLVASEESRSCNRICADGSDFYRSGAPNHRLHPPGLAVIDVEGSVCQARNGAFPGQPRGT